jgi:hypothetical protein
MTSGKLAVVNNIQSDARDVDQSVKWSWPSLDRAKITKPSQTKKITQRASTKVSL